MGYTTALITNQLSNNKYFLHYHASCFFFSCHEVNDIELTQIPLFPILFEKDT